MTMRNPTSECVWRRVLVYGLGASGTAASRLLLALGARVVGVDSRPAEAIGLDGLPGAGGAFEVHRDEELHELPADVDAAVVSPGVPLDRPLLEEARRRSLPVLAEVELAWHYLPGPVVAITGSNGKSTTTALTGAMLREAGFDVAVCGNIGPPLSAEIDVADLVAAKRGREGVRSARRLYVVEVSSFQLESIDSFRPRAAAFLNLAPDHLDRHGDLEGYTAAKRRIFENQAPDDVAVLNADDPVSRETPVRGRRRLFSLREPVEDGCWLDGDRVVEAGAGSGDSALLFQASDSRLSGSHNLANAMAAALLARAMGATADDCRRALGSFGGLPHRAERVAEVGGVLWCDDSKATNPAATVGCLRGFEDGSVHLILGGSPKDSDYGELRDAVAEKAVRVYLIGETAPEIEAALAADGGVGVPRVRAETLDRAVAEAGAAATAGQVVLLSPACASFDQFENFGHRGDEFQRMVREWLGTSSGGVDGSGAAAGGTAGEAADG